MPGSSRTAKNAVFSIAPVRLANSGKVIYAAVPADATPRAVRWSFLAFIFTLPFETQDLGALSAYGSLTRLAGLLFFAVYLAYYFPLGARGFPPMPRALWWFLGYIAACGLSSVLVGDGLAGMAVRLVTLIQLFMLLWVGSGLLKDHNFAVKSLLTFSAAVVILAAGMIFGFLGPREIIAGRTTVLREDLNGLATNMGLALIVFVGLYASSVFRSLWSKLVVAALSVPPLIAMIQTGSRGGFLAFVAGLLVFAVPFAQRKWRFGPGLIVVSIIAVAGYMVASSPEFRGRFVESYSEGRFAYREILFPVAIEMILERPIFGWSTEKWYLDFRTGAWADTGDPHNLVLHLMLEVGLLGTFPYLVGVFLCCRYAWLSRNGKLGLLPLALLTTFLVAGVSLTTVVWKTFWIGMAIAIAAAAGLSRQPIRAVRVQPARGESHSIGDTRGNVVS